MTRMTSLCKRCVNHYEAFENNKNDLSLCKHCVSVNHYEACENDEDDNFLFE